MSGDDRYAQFSHNQSLRVSTNLPLTSDGAVVLVANRRNDKAIEVEAEAEVKEVVKVVAVEIPPGIIPIPHKTSMSPLRVSMLGRQRTC